MWQANLTLSWRRPMSYRNQSSEFDIGLRHERVKTNPTRAEIKTVYSEMLSHNFKYSNNIDRALTIFRFTAIINPNVVSSLWHSTSDAVVSTELWFDGTDVLKIPVTSGVPFFVTTLTDTEFFDVTSTTLTGCDLLLFNIFILDFKVFDKVLFLFFGKVWLPLAVFCLLVGKDPFTLFKELEEFAFPIELSTSKVLLIFVNRDEFIAPSKLGAMLEELVEVFWEFWFADDNVIDIISIS